MSYFSHLAHYLQCVVGKGEGESFLHFFPFELLLCKLFQVGGIWGSAGDSWGYQWLDSHRSLQISREVAGLADLADGCGSYLVLNAVGFYMPVLNNVLLLGVRLMRHPKMVRVVFYI